jgi:hypothetical protein
MLTFQCSEVDGLNPLELLCKPVEGPVRERILRQCYNILSNAKYIEITKGKHYKARTAQTIITKEPALTTKEDATATTGVVDLGAPDPATGEAVGVATGATTGAATGGATGAGRTVSQRVPMMPALSQTHISPFQEPRLLHQERSYWKYAISETR